MDQSQPVSVHPDALAAFCLGLAQPTSPREEAASEAAKQESMRSIKRALQANIRKTHIAAREKKIRNCDFEIRNLSPSKKVNFDDIH